MLNLSCVSAAARRRCAVGLRRLIGRGSAARGARLVNVFDFSHDGDKIGCTYVHGGAHAMTRLVSRAEYSRRRSRTFDPCAS